MERATIAHSGAIMSVQIAMRPRFELRVALPCPQVFERVKAQVEGDAGGLVRAEYYWGSQIELRIRRDAQRLWTPELKLCVERSDEAHTTLRGRFGPDGHVWTLFLAMYALCGLAAFSGVMVLSSQLMVRGGGMWGGWLLAAGGVGAALVYALALVGQRLAQDHMERLHAALTAALPAELCQWG
jgi:hypothetical protein